MLLAVVAVVSCYQRALQGPASFHQFSKSLLCRLARPVNTAVASFTPAPAPGIDLFVARGYGDSRQRCAGALAFLDAAVVQCCCMLQLGALEVCLPGVSYRWVWYTEANKMTLCHDIAAIACQNGTP